MTRRCLFRWTLFVVLVLWGLVYIGWFTYLVRNSTDFIARQRAEAVCRVAPVAFGEIIGFAAKDVEQNMLASGWSVPEDWGVWSAERSATLVLPTTANDGLAATLELDLRAPTNRKFSLATVDVSVGGEKLIQWQLREDVNKQSRHRVSIPPRLLKGGTCVRLELRFAHAFRPANHGLGFDTRLLGIGLHTARWLKAHEEAPSGN